MVNSTQIDDLIAGKDRMIGELYSRCRVLEEAYKQGVKERDALAKELEELKTSKKDTP